MDDEFSSGEMVLFEKLEEIKHQIHEMREEIHDLSVNQQQFDADLSSFTLAVQNLIDAVNSSLGNQTNLSAEDQQVLQASQAVQAEMTRLQSQPATS